jgi:hypothetical protein
LALLASAQASKLAPMAWGRRVSGIVTLHEG